MRFYKEHWYYIGGLYFVALSFIMGFWGSHVSHVQLILIFSFMALLMHQFEEYALPGGFPAVFNMAVGGELKKPDRYPLNSEQAFIVNVALAYPFYIAAILLPGVIWLGLAQVLFGMFQIIVHGIVFNVKMRSWYNPGLATVVFLHFPIGIYYIWYVATNGLATTGDYVGGVVATIVAALLLVAMPLKFLADKESKHPFSDAEMKRFGVRERLKKAQD